MPPEQTKRVPNELEGDGARLRFQQICETARHYGNMRFAMFTVFSAFVGSMLSVEFGVTGVHLGARMLSAFRIAALLLTSLFGIAEWRLGQLVRFYQDLAARDRLELPLPESGHRVHTWLAKITMVAPFVLAALLWIYLIVSSLVS